MSEAVLFIIVAIPFLGAIVATFLPTHARDAAAGLAGAFVVPCLILTALAYPTISTGKVLRFEHAWIPSLGLNFIVRMDGFAWLFAMLVLSIGSLIVLYARYYMSPEDPVPRFFAFLLAFMGSMLGIVLSGNLIQIAFFWELTSLFSFLLIGYWSHTSAARDGARMALTITAAGGLCLFAGLLVIGYIVGSYDLDKVLAAGDRIRDHSLYLTALILVLLGALTKSAQFPFHFWLPHAMAAPTPVSAFLHSATLVKAGVFLLARFWPVLADTDAWFWIVGTSGMITMLLGAYVAIFQNDLKGLLAYSTISHLGLTTLLLGLNSKLGLVAAVFHIMNHATFKASLFMAAGIIDHETGTRDIRRLSGLRRFMPFTATLAIVAAAAMAGVPLLNGFLSKEMFFAETLWAPTPDPITYDLTPVAAVLASAFAVTYSLRFILGVFFGPDPVDLPRTPHEPPGWMRLPIEILVLACVVVGILPAYTIGPLLDLAVHSILGAETPHYSLALWHGVNEPLLMSLIALTAGAMLYMALQRHSLLGIDGAPFIRNFEGRRYFERTMVFLSWRVGRTLDRNLGTRRLQPQLRLILWVTILAAACTVYVRGLGPGNVPPSRVDPVLALVWIVGIACALGVAWQAKFHRLAALILLGGTGLATCVSFVWFSAPDLALTQLLVEIVTTVLLLLGLRWLPKRFQKVGGPVFDPITRTRRFTDLGIAIIAGVGMAGLAFAVMTRTPPELLGQEFLKLSYSAGGGKNAVNVILVDFRGFDTLFEITVLTAVALTVYALLRRFRPAADSTGIPEQQQEQGPQDAEHPDRAKAGAVADWLVVPSLISRLLFPIIALTAFFLLLRGHDLPGGGFVAGLTAAIALILQYMIGGTRWLEDRLNVQPLRWMGFGLLIAIMTALGAWLFGYPFLTSYFAYWDLPLLGKVPLASALLFDIGVYALVLGATTLMLIALAHQSVRGHRASQTQAEKRSATPGET
jgi:multicomponent K+:H+ antiporter subunit A